MSTCYLFHRIWKLVLMSQRVSENTCFVWRSPCFCPLPAMWKLVLLCFCGRLQTKLCFFSERFLSFCRVNKAGLWDEKQRSEQALGSCLSRLSDVRVIEVLKVEWRQLDFEVSFTDWMSWNFFLSPSRCVLHFAREAQVVLPILAPILNQFVCPLHRV